MPANAGDTGSTPGSIRSPGGGIATHSSIITGKIPRTEKSGRLQSMGSQRVVCDLVTKKQQNKNNNKLEFLKKIMRP